MQSVIVIAPLSFFPTNPPEDETEDEDEDETLPVFLLLLMVKEYAELF